MGGGGSGLLQEFKVSETLREQKCRTATFIRSTMQGHREREDVLHPPALFELLDEFAQELTADCAKKLPTTQISAIGTSSTLYPRWSTMATNQPVQFQPGMTACSAALPPERPRTKRCH